MVIIQLHSGAPRRPRRAFRTLPVLAALALLPALGARADAQQPEPAEAYGIYPPSNSAASDSAASDSAVPGGAVPGSAVPGSAPAGRASSDSTSTDSIPAPAAVADSSSLDLVVEPADDTSLTARMDVWRGGGLRREEFPDLRESAALTGRYGVFLDLMERSEYATALSDTGQVTVLAPTDSAFAALPAGVVQWLRADSAARGRWAGNLLVAGDLPVSGLLEAGELETMGGAAIRVSRGADGSVRAGEARLVQPDVSARNGMLHGVDRVTLPDSTAAEATSADP